MKALVLASAAALATAVPLHAEPRGVDLKAPDGITLKASYFPAAAPGPGVLLLHMCNSRRQVWDKLAGMLAARGMHVLTLDYRGYGESGGPPQRGQDDATRRAERAKWAADFDVALAHLLAQPGVDRARVAAGGGSCGVDNSVQLARRHPQVGALVLLAGGTNAAGQDFLAQNPGVPLFASAAHDDGDAVDVLRWLTGFSTHPATTLVEYERGGHGTDMFPVHADLEPAIADWLAQRMLKEPAADRAAGAPGPSARLRSGLSEAGGARRLLERWRADHETPLAPEAVINIAGYEHLAAGRHADAIALFTLNVEARPQSLNALDSLSEAHATAGDHAAAREWARRTLDAIARDTVTSAEFKQQLRQLAEARLREPAK